MKLFWIYMVVINIVTMTVYYIDKEKAKRNKWRISEATLIGLAAMGGFAGAFLGMKIFRHKTKHIKFVVGIPLISVVWIAGMIVALRGFG